MPLYYVKIDAETLELLSKIDKVINTNQPESDKETQSDFVKNALKVYLDALSKVSRGFEILKKHEESGVVSEWNPFDAEKKDYSDEARTIIGNRWSQTAASHVVQPS